MTFQKKALYGPIPIFNGVLPRRQNMKFYKNIYSFFRLT